MDEYELGNKIIDESDNEDSLSDDEKTRCERAEDKISEHKANMALNQQMKQLHHRKMDSIKLEESVSAFISDSEVETAEIDDKMSKRASCRLNIGEYQDYKGRI